MLDLRTVYECNRCLGCKTLHPQVGIINLENPSLEEDAVKFEFYAVLLIEDCPGGCCCCGRKYYDYSNATMVFLTPGEIFRMSKENTLPDKGYLLAFHPDLLFRTSLKNHIKNYTFFHYRKEEALHLSRRETEKVTCCLGFARHPDVKTPYLDTLASRGISFDNAYSACPSCIAARAALHTGLSQEHHKRTGYEDGIIWDYPHTWHAF